MLDNNNMALLYFLQTRIPPFTVESINNVDYSNVEASRIEKTIRDIQRQLRKCGHRQVDMDEEEDEEEEEEEEVDMFWGQPWRVGYLRQLLNEAQRQLEVLFDNEGVNENQRIQLSTWSRKLARQHEELPEEQKLHFLGQVQYGRWTYQKGKALAWNLAMRIPANLLEIELCVDIDSTFKTTYNLEECCRASTLNINPSWDYSTHVLEKSNQIKFGNQNHLIHQYPNNRFFETNKVNIQVMFPNLRQQRGGIYSSYVNRMKREVLEEFYDMVIYPAIQPTQPMSTQSRIPPKSNQHTELHRSAQGRFITKGVAIHGNGIHQITENIQEIVDSQERLSEKFGGMFYHAYTKGIKAEFRSVITPDHVLLDGDPLIRLNQSYIQSPNGLC
jgi:hypothetical protein